MTETSTTTITYRRATLADQREMLRVFRHSVADLLQRMGHDGADYFADEADLDMEWAKRRNLLAFLHQHAAEDWIALRSDGNGHEEIVGMARSIRDEHVLELTEFFVSPTAQSAGVGRELLSRALPAEPGVNRCIIATTDVRAMARYLKAGLHMRFSIYEFFRVPQPTTPPANLAADALTESDETVAWLREIDEAVLGYRRDDYHRWLLTNRTCFRYAVDGQTVGYGYVGEAQGPFAALDPAHIAAMLAHAEGEAAERGGAEFRLVVPMENAAAVGYLLRVGFRMDPFTMQFLSDEPFGKFDRYISMDPALLL